MRKFFSYLTVALCLACTNAAQAQDIESPWSFGDHSVSTDGPIRLASCESEIACTGNVAPARTSYLSFGAEMPLLSVYANHGSGAASTNWFNDFDSNAALRVTAAYQTDGILGIRGRYFTFGATGSPTPIDQFDVELYDLDAMAGLNIAGWNISGFGGLKWGSINFSNRFSNVIQDFDGFGMTGGADVRRNVGCGLALTGGVRQSYLYGNSTINTFPSRISNAVVPITELRLGTDYTMQLRGSNKLIAGIGFEHQQFNGLSVRNATIDPEDVDVGLSGPVLSLTWLR
jgi:hypothetical protein